MHDTWNPWHGCKKISEGCANCYMYFLDQIRAQDGSLIRLTNNMKKPLAKNRKGEYKGTQKSVGVGATLQNF